MNIAIIGSRKLKNTNDAENQIRKILAQIKNKYPDAMIISGEAPGIDSIAENIAKNEFKLTVLTYPAPWNDLPKIAGIYRNTKIVNKADIVLAFWDRKSPGTKDSILKAIALGKKVVIYTDGFEPLTINNDQDLFKYYMLFCPV